MKHILSVFGTRPEVIKMAPVVRAINAAKGLKSIVCTTSQHRTMQDQMMQLFGLKADHDLNIMRSNQDLFDITQAVLKRLPIVIQKFKPDMLLVQGDTTTSFVASLVGFYMGIPVGHVEAGLRTYNMQAPFPEEGNRQLTSRIASLHFAPTKTAEKNLLQEGVNKKNIFVTGNTVIDALLWMKDHLNSVAVTKALPTPVLSLIKQQHPFVLVTGHRRESFGEGFLNICNAIKMLAEKYPHMSFVYPVHLNPNVQGPVFELLSSLKNVHLISPVEYEPFVYLMQHCKLVLTDSGGVQEEAPSLGKPVLVMREVTERPEGVEAGTARVVGTECNSIVKEVTKLIDSEHAYNAMANAVNPYGDGTAALKINSLIQDYYSRKEGVSVANEASITRFE